MWKLLRRRDGKPRRPWPVLVLAVVLAWLWIPPGGKRIGMVGQLPILASESEVPAGAERPDPAVLAIWDRWHQAQMAPTRYAASYCTVSIRLPDTIGRCLALARARHGEGVSFNSYLEAFASSRHAVHGYQLQYTMCEDRYVDGQAEQRSWSADVLPNTRHEAWQRAVTDGHHSWVERSSPDEPDGLALERSDRPEQLARHGVSLDTAAPWRLPGMDQRLRKAPSLLTGTETIDGLQCQRLQFKESSMTGPGGTPGWSTYWICPARGYEIVRCESTMAGPARAGAVGLVPIYSSVHQVTNWSRVGDQWYPTAFRSEAGSQAASGPPMLQRLEIRVVQQLRVGADVPALSVVDPVPPPGAVIRDLSFGSRAKGGQSPVDTREPLRPLEEILRRGDWDAVGEEMARLGVPQSIGGAMVGEAVP